MGNSHQGIQTICVITVTYGDRGNMVEKLACLALQNSYVSRMIVVSNGSSSDLRPIQERFGARLKVIYFEKNGGSARGFKAGIESALEYDEQILLLMDDDNLPGPGSIELLTKELGLLSDVYGREKTAVVGFRPSHQTGLLEGHGKLTTISRRSSFLGIHFLELGQKIYRRVLSKKKDYKINIPPLLKIPYAPYGGLMAHRVLFECIGLPRTDFILYADDTELTSRITKADGKIFLITDARLHDQEKSWGQESYKSTSFQRYIREKSDFRVFYSIRNRSFLDFHEFSDSKISTLLNVLIFCICIVFVGVLDRNYIRIRLILSAVHDGLLSRLGEVSRFPLP